MPEKYKRKGKAAKKIKLSIAGLPQVGKWLFSRTSFWLALSLIVLMIVILTSLGLWGYQSSLTKEKETLAKQIEDLTNQRDLDLEANFIDLKQKIENLKNILQTHIYPSQVFNMLEELTLPQVQFVTLSADLSQAKLALSAETIDYQTLAKQVFVFEQDWRIEKIEVLGVKLGTSGRVSSDLDIKLNLDFLFSQ